MTILHHFETDAFSNGQVDSKIWLCKELERIIPTLPRPFRSGQAAPVVWILGGWYGVLSFLLLSRGNVGIANIRSFDQDEHATEVADQINNNWVINGWRFKAFTADANWLEYAHATQYGPAPDIIINTASEHFYSSDWFDRLPEDVLVVVQSNDMVHHEHLFLHKSLHAHKKEFPLTHTLFEGKMMFTYPDWSFTRFMTIGYK